MTMRGAIKAYNKTNVDSQAVASPYKVVQLLFGGAIDKLGQVRGHIEQANMAKKGETLSKVMDIIGVLQGSLDMEAGGEIAANLNALYDYMFRCLSEVNINNDQAKLDEVINLLIELKVGWDQIPPEQQNA